MKSVRPTAALRNLRQQPLWRLLAADKAPVVIALMQVLLLDADQALPGSILVERLSRELDQLRIAGEDLPQAPQAYLADWLAQGWLVRRLAPGATEEMYQLTADAADAIRYVSGILKPRASATESRLSTVIRQLARLAEETDPDPASRIAALEAERARIDREIEAVRTGVVVPLPTDRALERARDVIRLADELAGDFRRVRDAFEKLNRSLRERLMDNDGSRGEVLEALFAGVDLIGESEAGRTFAAFWRLLTDPEQSATLSESLSDVVSRPFARSLEAHERRFLLDLTRILVDEGGGVHEVLQHFARSLRSFVQSREYLEQRRMHALIRDAQRAALEARHGMRPNEAVGYALVLANSRIRSASQWQLHDPAERIAVTGMADGEVSALDLETVGELVRQSEIDFRTLRDNIRRMLAERTQVTIPDLLDRFPAPQGLGTVVGYIALGARHGEIGADTHVAAWSGEDAVPRRARIPMIWFLRERADELAG